MYVIFLYQVSQIFQDKELCIVNGPPSHSKSLLEKKVAEVFLVPCSFQCTIRGKDNIIIIILIIIIIIIMHAHTHMHTCTERSAKSLELR